jgi:hypothetical protein
MISAPFCVFPFLFPCSSLYDGETSIRGGYGDGRMDSTFYFSLVEVH